MSKKANDELIKTVYTVLLGRLPEEEGKRYWEEMILSHAVTADDFILMIMRSDEFRDRLGRLGISGTWKFAEEMGCDLLIPLPFSVNGHEACLLAPVGDTSVTQGILYTKGAYEPHVCRALKSCLSPGDTVIDVGANIGFITLFCSHLVGNDGNVLSFEPSSVAASYLEKSVKINGISNVSLYRLGLWSEEKTLGFDTRIEALGTSHINVGSPSGDTIACVQLDALASSVDLSHLAVIKMDIEGAEPFALEGMRETLCRYRPALVMEINRPCLSSFGVEAHNVLALLNGMGYTVSVLSNSEDRETEVDKPDDFDDLCPPGGLVDIVARPNR